MGTSWIYDLMLSAQNAATAQGRPYALWFSGSGSLGATLNLGINTRYLAKENQNRVDDQDIVAGLTTDITPSVITQSGIGAYQAKAWDYNNAVALSGLLLNPNLNNYNTTSKTFGAVPANPRGNNRQDQVLQDFFAVYTATLTDNVNTNGSWEEARNKIQSGTTTDQKKRIQYALFGSGIQEDGLIDASQIKLGGAGLNVGSKITQATLGKGTRTGIAPALIEYAWNPFAINTPQRIIAFLAQSKQETSFVNLREQLKHRNSSAVARLFTSSFTNSSKPGAVNDEYRDKNRTAESNAAAYIKDNIPASGSGTSAWTKYEKDFANRVYSTDYGNGAGGYTRDSEKIWDYIGRGLIQLTGPDLYQKFIEFLEINPRTELPSSELVANNHELIASDLRMAAYSAGWYWNINSINAKADSVGRFGAYAEKKYLEVTVAVNGKGKAGAAERWKYFNELSKKAYADGNPYESIRSALERLGVVATNSTGYESRIGITLNKRTAKEIESPSENKLTADSFSRTDLTSERAMGSEDFLDNIKSLLKAQRGEIAMFDFLPPEIAYDTHVDLREHQHASTSQRQQEDASEIRGIYGVCKFMPSVTANRSYAQHSETYYTLEVSATASDIGLFEHPQLPDLDFYGNAFTVVEQPKHGKLIRFENKNTLQDLRYEPDNNYVGVDKVVVLVKGVDQRTRDRVEFNLVYFLKITKESYQDYLRLGEKVGRKYCPTLHWPISVPESSDDARRNDDMKVVIRAAELLGAEVGKAAIELESAIITLSPTAAGYGWFIRPHPVRQHRIPPHQRPVRVDRQAGLGR